MNKDLFYIISKYLYDKNLLNLHISNKILYICSKKYIDRQIKIFKEKKDTEIIEFILTSRSYNFMNILNGFHALPYSS